MGKKLAYERYLWLQAQIKKGEYPNAKDLSEKFEISRRQALRDIEFMRDRIKAPLEYCSINRGYYFSDKTFELPIPRITEKEIIGWVIAERLAGAIPCIQIREEINSYIKKTFQMIGLDLDELAQNVSIKNIRYNKVESPIFEKVIQGLSTKHKLEIKYIAKYKKSESTRIVNPLHLLLYQGNWHLFAFCEKESAIRNFELSVIKDVRILNDPIKEDRKRDIGKMIEENYGIFIHENAEDKVDVVLKFNKDIKEIIKNQVWFPLQKLEEKEDGSVLLTFPVSDFREIESDILRYGYNIEVLQPPQLRERIKDTLLRMYRMY
jgi:predicted DNA-binding transcriptional regulator YafY